jgi:hypothetical protein
VPAPEHSPLIDGVVRQSTLRTFDQCELAASWELEGFHDYTSDAAALGTVAHGILAAILETLKETGQDRIPTEEAMVIMREVAARPDMPRLSSKGLADLRIVTIQVAGMQWTASRVVAIERRLWADVTCPDGKTRQITGQPDFIMADPPGGAIVGDLKTGWARPPEPRDGNWDREQGKPYLSERGHFQLDIGALLVFRNFPLIERCTLREWHIRWGETREAFLTRDELEHVEHRVGILLQRFEDMLAGRRAPEPREGAHCRRICPRITECPIPQAQRRESIVSDEHAAEVARHYAVVSAGKDRDTALLKPFLDDQEAKAIEIPGGYVGWRQNGERRSFGVHDRPDAP